jgi:gas vesicle protein
MKNIRILLYTLTGLAAGIGIGLLLAPSAGSETRNRILSSVGKLKSRFGFDEEEFSDSELEMDATSGRAYGY